MTDMLDQTPDADLMVAVRRGDQAAFSVIVTRHHGRLYALAWRILNDAAAAEDVVQDAMLKLWTGADRFDPSRGLLSAWLKRMVVNQCLDRRRALRSVEDIETATGISDDAPLPDVVLDQRHVARAMEEMPPRQRAAIALFYIEGYTMAEVADQLDTNTKSVESLLARGREKLRDLLGRWAEQPRQDKQGNI
jgi:RNA polymerase sigma-70 factor (ECF subfamily)